MSRVSKAHKARVLAAIKQHPAGIGFNRLQDLARLVSEVLENVLQALRKEKLVLLQDCRYFDAEDYHKRFLKEEVRKVRKKKKPLDTVTVGGVEMYPYKLKFLNALAAQYEKSSPDIANDIKHIRDDLVKFASGKGKAEEAA